MLTTVNSIPTFTVAVNDCRGVLRAIFIADYFTDQDGYSSMRCAVYKSFFNQPNIVLYIEV